MKYRTKLYLFFLALALVAILSSLTIILFDSRKAIHTQLKSAITAVAASAAVSINGNLVEKIQTQADASSPAYLELQETLQKMRNANRRKHFYVNYLFIVRPDPKDSQTFEFVVSDEKKSFALVGKADLGATQDLLQDHLNEFYSSGELTKNEYGISLSGYAPIYNSQNKYVGSVSANISAQEVDSTLNLLYLHALVTLIASFLLATLAAVFLAKHAATAIEKLKQATVEISKPNFAYRVRLETHDEFQDLGESLNKMCVGLQEKERLKEGFAHYVSSYVLDRIVKARGSAKLEGEKRKVTVLFSDIRGFTHMAERMEPEKVVGLLNEYFQVMIDIIFKYNGMLDKLIGDGIMAEFGAPLDDPEQEKNAILSAKEMIQKLGILREKWQKEGKPEIHIGIGIHTGEAIVGSIGSEKRMEYTAIGDTVNIASRLQVISKEKHTPIVVSESTYNQVKEAFEWEALGPVTLVGRDQPIHIYSLKLD